MGVRWASEVSKKFGVVVYMGMLAPAFCTSHGCCGTAGKNSWRCFCCLQRILKRSTICVCRFKESHLSYQRIQWQTKFQVSAARRPIAIRAKDRDSFLTVSDCASTEIPVYVGIDNFVIAHGRCVGGIATLVKADIGKASRVYIRTVIEMKCAADGFCQESTSYYIESLVLKIKIVAIVNVIMNTAQLRIPQIDVRPFTALTISILQTTSVLERLPTRGD